MMIRIHILLCISYFIPNQSISSIQINSLFILFSNFLKSIGHHKIIRINNTYNITSCSFDTFIKSITDTFIRF